MAADHDLVIVELHGRLGNQLFQLRPGGVWRADATPDSPSPATVFPQPTSSSPR